MSTELEGKLSLEVIMYQTQGAPTTAIGGGGDPNVTVGAPGAVVFHKVNHEIVTADDYTLAAGNVEVCASPE
jgi:hypothetical protein